VLVGEEGVAVRRGLPGVAANGVGHHWPNISVEPTALSWRIAREVEPAVESLGEVVSPVSRGG